MSVVTTEERGPVLWATIDRPGALNAIDFEVMGRLEELLERLHTERRWRALVLRGAGERAFVSGGDLKALAPLRQAAQARRMATRMKVILAELERLDCWTIACVNGPAFGGGCEVMLAFDQRIASDRATIGWTQTRFMVPCGWGGMTRLVELVGRATAVRWLACASVLPAEHALEAGMLDAVVPHVGLEAATQELAMKMSQQPRHMIAALKGAALRALEVSRRVAIDAELEDFARLWAEQAHHDRVEAFLQRRRARGGAEEE